MLHVAWIKNECESVDRSVTVHQLQGFILTVKVLLFISPKKAYRSLKRLHVPGHVNDIANDITFKLQYTNTTELQIKMHFISFDTEISVLLLFLSPQGSLDNISIIIVCFPGAPELSQEALQREAELEQLIDMKVEGDLLLN